MNQLTISPTPAPSAPSVRLLTALAAVSDISPDEYRAIYDQVAEGRSLRNIELALRSGVSFGWWSRYANGEKELDRERKNELRVWAGLPELPPTPAEAVAAQAHPDAAVYQVGAQPASRIVLVGADVPAVSLRLNGNCTITTDSPVQAVTAPARQPRPHYERVTLQGELLARLRAAAGDVPLREWLALVADGSSGGQPPEVT